MVCFLLLFFQIQIILQPTVAENSRGLFISAITASEITALPRYVAAAKAAAATSFPSSSDDTIISSFVLSPISSNKGFAYRALDALLPIISKNNSSIYIGTNWRSNSELHMHDTYCGQLVFNKTFAQADADDSARIATEFVTRYPQCTLFMVHYSGKLSRPFGHWMPVQRTFQQYLHQWYYSFKGIGKIPQHMDASSEQSETVETFFVVTKLPRNQLPHQRE